MVMCHKGDGNALGGFYAILVGGLLAASLLGALVTGEWMPFLWGVGLILGSVLVSLFWLVALWPLLRLTAALAEKIARRQKNGPGSVKHDMKDK